MEPCGITIKFEYEGKTYHIHLFNNWDLYKTIGNSQIEVGDSLIIFDEAFNLIPYDSALYEIFIPLVEEYIS